MENPTARRYNAVVYVWGAETRRAISLSNCGGGCIQKHETFVEPMFNPSLAAEESLSALARLARPVALLAL
jgi:hypothetical protein